MKQTLETYIQDKDFQQLLLKLDGGILKFWAEHPDMEFDGDLYDKYENQIAEDYLQACKRNRAIRSLPTDMLKNKSLDWYRQSKGSELKFLVALKPELNAIDEELFEQLLKYIKVYMSDAYKESRRRKYPNGIPPQDFYDEVIEKYGPLGLALDCLERVLQESRGKAVHITDKHFILKILVHPGESPKWKEENNLQTEFDIKMFFDTFYADGDCKKLRQAVKEMIDNSTQKLSIEESREACRKIAIDEMRKVYWFTRWVNNESYPIEQSKEGERVPLITPEERQWLRNIDYVDSSCTTRTQEQTTMQRYFSNFTHLLQNIGKIWAAQLVVRGIDMKELERETGIVLSRLPNPLYYWDRFADDHRGDCCVYDMSEVKKLLARIKRKTPYCPKELTREEEKQCFKNAVLNVMEQKKEDGCYLFEKPTQWKAVYRFAIDIGIMYDKEDPNEPKDKSTPQYAVFEKFAKELQLDKKPPTRLPFTKNAINDINKEFYVHFNAPYPWSQDGLTDHRSFTLYSELDDVYKALEEDYYNLVFQEERA